MQITIMTPSIETSYLEIILGSMFSGKTSRLVEIYKMCKFCNIPVAAINHCIDDRYDKELLSTHDHIKIPCIKTRYLLNLLGENENTNDIQKSEVILINEGQFFEDLYEFINILLKNGKKIYVCGLDGDFERKKFGQILDIIPLCDKVTKLTSLCSICKNGTPGIFSKRITCEKEQTIVGSDNYIPVCRKCYQNELSI
jgi:thymidine kinase